MEYKEVHLEQGSDAWLNWRSGGIGASDASTIMGENRFKQADELLYEKIHQVNTPVNAAMMEGTRLEPEARRAYEEEKNADVVPLCIESVEYPWLRASLDGISKQRDLLVEIKCGRSSMRKAQQGEIPDYYYGQIQHQLMITGLEVIDYWCYRPECGGILLQAERDDTYMKELFEVERKFFEELQNA
jgi:putative phage-type endonuclease